MTVQVSGLRMKTWKPKRGKILFFFWRWRRKEKLFPLNKFYFSWDRTRVCVCVCGRESTRGYLTWMCLRGISLRNPFDEYPTPHHKPIFIHTFSWWCKKLCGRRKVFWSFPEMKSFSLQDGFEAMVKRGRSRWCWNWDKRERLRLIIQLLLFHQRVFLFACVRLNHLPLLKMHNWTINHGCASEATAEENSKA